MPTFDDFTAAFPAPRDDEPPELRAQIAKELRDHLQCAVQRELVLCGNEREAAQRALAKFGAPARIARQLWREALWEKIMSQRILVGLCTVMTVACIGMGLFNWRAAADSAEAVRKLIEHSDAANRALVEQSHAMNRVMLEQSRASNQALVEKMGSLVAMNGAQQSPEWVPVKIRLVLDTPDGAPAVGFAVSVSNQNPLSTAQPTDQTIWIDEKSSAQGIVDCGKLRSGNYYVTITAPSGEECRTDFFARAGVTEQIETIVCPGAPLPVADVTLELELPADLRGRSFAALCEIMHEDRMLDDKAWRRMLPEDWGTRIVTENRDLWSVRQIDYLPQGTPPHCKLHGVERVTQLRWPGGKHGMRMKGIIFFGVKDSLKSVELVPWIQAGDGNDGIYSQLTTKAASANHLKVTMPQYVIDEIRTAFGQKPEPAADSGKGENREK